MKNTRTPLAALVLSSALLFAACGSSLESTTPSQPDLPVATSAEAAPSESASPLAEVSSEPASEVPSDQASESPSPSPSVEPTTESPAPSPTPSPVEVKQVDVAIGEDLPFPAAVNNSKPRLTERLRAEAVAQGYRYSDADADDCWYFAGNTLSDGGSISETLLCPVSKTKGPDWMMLDPNNDYAVQGYFWMNPRMATSTGARDAAESFVRPAGGTYRIGTLREARIEGPSELYGYVID